MNSNKIPNFFDTTTSTSSSSSSNIGNVFASDKSSSSNKTLLVIIAVIAGYFVLRYLQNKRGVASSSSSEGFSWPTSWFGKNQDSTQKQQTTTSKGLCNPVKCNSAMKGWIDKGYSFDDSTQAFADCANCPRVGLRSPMDVYTNGRWASFSDKTAAYNAAKLS